jgi:uncharacterized protein (TIGR02594 family)
MLAAIGGVVRGVDAAQVNLALNDCPWMRVAIGELGQREVPGVNANNPRIVAYHSSVGLNEGDETPWCSAFANWCMTRVGVTGSGSAWARSWLQWGCALSATYPVFGAVVVFSRGLDLANGHVAFLVGTSKDHFMMLGGNQSSPFAPTGEVCVKSYLKSRILGVRWPTYLPTTARLRHLVADRE